MNFYQLLSSNGEIERLSYAKPSPLPPLKKIVEEGCVEPACGGSQSGSDCGDIIKYEAQTSITEPTSSASDPYFRDTVKVDANSTNGDPYIDEASFNDSSTDSRITEDSRRRALNILASIKEERRKQKYDKYRQMQAPQTNETNERGLSPSLKDDLDLSNRSLFGW